MGILEILERNRTSILLAEIGAYLHLIGRFSDKFIYSQALDADSNDNFNYKNVCNDSSFFESTDLDIELKDTSWKSLLNNFLSTNLGELSTNRIQNFCEFIKKHTWGDNPKGLCRILADAHGIVSGIDKALAGRGSTGKQKKAFTYKATAFGYETEIELLKNHHLKKELHIRVKEFLKKIKSSQSISYEDYISFIDTIRDYYSKTIGETRRPINEISLHDYVYTISALMKSNLAKMIIDGWYDPKGRSKSKWRILGINIDVINYMSQGIKIGDILGYKDQINTFFNHIKKLIEYDYPLGKEIYRDSTGIYFSCPDLNQIDELKKEVLCKISNLVNQDNEDLHIDYSLHINISDASRSMVILSKEREESLRKICYVRSNDESFINRTFETYNNGKEICPVCKVRLKENYKYRCSECEKRFVKRSKEWLNGCIENTIWLDEVADHNDRIALLIGHFDLRRWLNGEFIGTFLSQTFEKWKKENANTCSNLKINSLSDLENGFKNIFNNPSTFNNDWKQICMSFIGYPREGFNSINEFWAPLAERDATGEALSLTDNQKKAKYLIKLLFRKHPSLARINRIWNTTQEFINEIICENIIKNYFFNFNPRRKRIQFKIDPKPTIDEASTCDIDLGFSPVCIDKEKGIFVSTANLQILKKFGNTAEEIAINLNNKKIKVKTENNRSWRDARIIDAKLAEDKFQNYLPYIKIYDFPDQFMILVPAYEAFEIAKRIYEEYEIQFSKVRDRLPFHLGIIAFHRRTPLYVAMDAGKRLLKAFSQKTITKEVSIKSISDFSDTKFGKFAKKLELSEIPGYSSTPLTWCISYSTGDPEQEDEWHPYIRIVGSNPNRDPYSFDYTGNGNYVVHVKKLQENDTIQIEPSYFKMIFLENASDRFKIDDDLRPIDDIRRVDELWNDIQKIIREKKLGIAQLYTYWQEVEKRKREYDDNSVKANFIKDSIINIFKISPQKEKSLLDKLFQTTLDGLLNLSLYWNLQVRKIKPK